MKIFGIAGHSGMGKTTLLERLVPEIASRGLSVSLIKHSHKKNIDIDRPGKDSYRLREAGCMEVLLLGNDRWALMHELRGARSPRWINLLDRMQDCDLVLIEGFKHGDFPKLEVWRASLGQATLWPDWPGILAIASDQPPTTPAEMAVTPGLSHFQSAGRASIAAFVLSHAQVRRPTPGDKPLKNLVTSPDRPDAGRPGDFCWHSANPRPARVMPNCGRCWRCPGDPARGKTVFTPCEDCHRKDASGRANGIFPRLSGQHASVILKQVLDIRAGRRINPTMLPLVAESALANADLAGVAAYLQGLPFAAKQRQGARHRPGPGQATVRARLRLLPRRQRRRRRGEVPTDGRPRSTTATCCARSSRSATAAGATPTPRW